MYTRVALVDRDDRVELAAWGETTQTVLAGSIVERNARRSLPTMRR